VFTSLHRALGRGPGDFDYDMLVEAVQQKITEEVDLEWKQQPPRQEGSGWRPELAKDFAAMANAGGGVFVYGIAEDRATSAAAELVDAGDVGQVLERELRKVAYALVYPGISGLESYPLKSPDGVRELVVRVAPSRFAPHFIRHEREPHFLAAPVRRGRDTYWLTELEIESAYRSRFRTAGDILRELEEAFRLEATFVERWAEPNVAWLTAVAHPLEPRSHLLAKPTPDEAATALDAGRDLYARILEGRPYAMVYDRNVRPGRHGWTANRGPDSRQFERIGHDGSVVVSQWVGDPTTHDDASFMGVDSYDVERAAGHVVATIAGVTRALALNGPHLVRVGIHRMNAGLPIRFGIHHRYDDRPVFTGVPVLLEQVLPEVLEVDGAAEEESLRASMAQITTLMTSQGGIMDLRLTHPRRPR
jgi:hypothetical protein